MLKRLLNSKRSDAAWRRSVQVRKSQDNLDSIAYDLSSHARTYVDSVLILTR